MISLAALLFNGCTSKGIAVTDVWARPGNAGDNSAVFFVVQNSTADDDTLLHAESDVAGAVELHRTIMEDDVMRMMPQESVAIPAQAEVVFKPGDYHVMLIGLRHDLSIGDSFPLTLHFEKAGEIALTVRVKAE